MTTTATFTKLRSGNWGVRVPFQVAPEDIVTVTKKSGTTKNVVIGKIVWRGKGVAIAEIIPEPRYQGAGHAKPAARKSDTYNTGDYRITASGEHQVKVMGPRGMYWRKADKWDQFDEFDC